MKPTPAVDQRPTLGTILVDANILAKLCNHVPDHMRNAGSRSRYDDSSPPLWVDALPLLAELGFEIVIPEMVALEIGAINADGCSYEKLFERNKKSKQEDEVSAFLKRVAQGEFGSHIQIVRPADDDQSHSAQYVRQINSALLLYSSRNTTFHDMHRRDALSKTAKRMLMNGHKFRKNNNWQDLGEEAAAQWVARQADQNHPLIGLSSDEKFYKDITNASMKKGNNRICYSLNLQGLILALIANGVLGAIGVNEQANYESIIDHFNVKDKEQKELSMDGTLLVLNKARIVDRSYNPATQYKRPNAFRDLLKSVKDNINQKDVENSESGEQQDSSAIAARRTARLEKYGRHRFAGQNGSGSSRGA